MNIERLHEALGILKVHDPKGYIAVEHDEMWAGGPDPDSMPPTVVCRLNDLGFTWDENVESWHAFV